MYETCCFTGPRPGKLFPLDKTKAYDRSGYAGLLAELQTRIAQLCEIGVEIFLSGCAQGVDQIAFWAVRHVQKQYPHIRNVASLPFEGYGEQWGPGAGAFGRDDLRQILERADEVCIVRKGKPAGDDIAKALRECSQYMIDHADVVLGVSMEHDYLFGSGGTAECLRYADRKGKKIRVIHPLDKTLTQFEIIRPDMHASYRYGRRGW